MTRNSDNAAAIQNEGIAAALREEPDTFYSNVASEFEGNFNLLAAALTKMGIEVCAADGQIGGYFLVADVSSTGKTDLEFCKWIATEKGVAAVPLTVFYAPKPEGWKCHLVRFAICKKRPTIIEACAKLTAGLTGGGSGSSVAVEAHAVAAGAGADAGAGAGAGAGVGAAVADQRQSQVATPTSPIAHNPHPSEDRPASATPSWWG